MNKKSILLFSISIIFLFSACTSGTESKAPTAEAATEALQMATETPSSSTQMFTEDDYIKMAKGEATMPGLDKEIPKTEYFIRPALADTTTEANIYISELGYEFAFTPNESAYPYDATMFVSDMEFGIDTPLIDAMKAVYPQINESEFTYVGDNEVKHYVKVENDSTTNQMVTQVYFLYKSHLISFTILGDASGNYLGYCNVKVVYF